MKAARLLSAASAAALCLAPAARGAITIDNFTPATNDRFANDPSFVASGFDLSGMGRTPNGRWLVMISPTVFLSAAHFPATGTAVFHPGNDPLTAPVVASIAGAETIGSSDLWIGHLTDPLPDSIGWYPIAGQPLTAATFSDSELAGGFAFLTGISPTGSGYGADVTTNQAVGTNRIEGMIDNLTIGGRSGDVLVTVRNQPGDSGFSYTPFEADLNSGDSGSALMWVNDGVLTVAGIAWASGTANIAGGAPEGVRDISVYTYTGNFASEIEAYVAAHPIPEPAAGMLGLLGAAALLRRRRAA